MSSWKVLKERGDADFNNALYNDAINAYTAALALQPDDVITHSSLLTNRCLCHVQLGNPATALDDARSALQLRPRWAKAHVRVAQCYELLGNIEQAIEFYQRTTELDPSLRDHTIKSIESLHARTAQLRCQLSMAPQPTDSGRQPVYAAALRPPSYSTIAAAYGDGSLRLWCATTGSILRVLDGHTNAVTTLAWSSDGSLLGSGSLDTTARIWKEDTVTRNTDVRCSNGADCTAVPEEEVLHFTAISVLERHNKRVSALKFIEPCAYEMNPKIPTAFGLSAASVHPNASDRMVATASPDCTVCIWRLDPVCCLQVLSAHTALVSDIAVSPCGSILAAASGDATFTLWDLLTGTSVGAVSWESGPVVMCGFLPAIPNTHSDVQRAPRKALLLTAHAQLARCEGRILLWDVVERRTGWVDGRLRAPAWAIDGLKGRPVAWDAVEREEESLSMLLCVVCADGAGAVWELASDDAPVKLFDLCLDTPLRHGVNSSLPPWHAAALQASSAGRGLQVAFSRSENNILCTGVKPSAHDKSCYLAVSSSSREISLWRIDDTVTQVFVFKGHKGVVRTLRWVDRHRLLSAAEDGLLRVWNVGQLARGS